MNAEMANDVDPKY